MTITRAHLQRTPVRSSTVLMDHALKVSGPSYSMAPSSSSTVHLDQTKETILMTCRSACRVKSISTMYNLQRNAESARRSCVAMAVKSSRPLSTIPRTASVPTTIMILSRAPRVTTARQSSTNVCRAESELHALLGAVWMHAWPAPQASTRAV